MSSQPIKLDPPESGGAGSGSGKKKSKKRDVIPVHESIEPPIMPSAPPSGNNLDFIDPLSNPLPPPPPPPPPRVGGLHLFQTLHFQRHHHCRHNNRQQMTAPSSLSSSSSYLPPPPQVSPPPQVTTTQVQTTGGPMFPPPPLPPPPPPPPPPSQQQQQQQQQVINKETTAFGYDNNNNNPMTSGPTPPAPLPITAFAPKDVTTSVLAKRQTHIPILVISTEAANHLAWKNSLHLVDMFQGIVQHELRLQSNNSMTPFRSIYKSLFPTDIKIQFVEPTKQMNPLSYNDAHDMLHENAKIQSTDGNITQDLLLLEDRVDELLQERIQDESLEDATKDAYQLTSPLDIPWLVRYKYALDLSTNSLPHDLINCPPLILLVCTTNEIEPPEQVLQELYNSPHVLPDAFKNGLYDPQAVRHEVLVLHDAVDGPSNVDDNRLRQHLQSQFGPNAAVLRINSVLPETAVALADQEEKDLWGGNGQLGNYLSNNDRVLLRRYFQTIVTTSLLPALERRISDLNAIVSERKKGVRNLVKSFWRKPKEENPGSALGGPNGPGGSDDNDDVKYRYDSIESQTRLLADTLFLMQDYEAALSIYRLIRDDFKSDKALSYYANVQEMMALCMYQMDPHGRSREIFSHLETALLSYTRAAEEERTKMNKDSAARPSVAPHSTRLATRLCLIMAAASDSLTKGREVEVADLLASASSHESNLGAAVLLEQSSAFYYAAGMYRKYAFHILMSGHMFRTAGQDHHAFRCFTSALYVYRNGNWHELHNHLRSALAAQLYTMGRMSVALILYAKLIGTGSGGKVSVKSQQKFLQHMVEICENHKKAALAGADRMASPPSIPSNQREAFRNAQLERIVNIIRYNRNASRVLELPYVDLPLIVDSTVRLWTHAEQHFQDTKKGEIIESAGVEQSLTEEFGKSAKGEDRIWNDLELMAIAEINAVDSSKPAP